MEGDRDMLDDDVSNIVHRDECFLSSIDFTTACSSPATCYLDKFSYISVDDTLEETHLCFLCQGSNT